MPRTFSRTFRIRYYECDAYGHLYNANYLRLMQETATDASAAAGFDTAYYQRTNSTWWIHQSDIEYLIPLRSNDRVVIKTWVEDFRRASSRRKYEFWNEGTGQLAATAHSDWVYLDLTRNRPASVPDEMKAGFFPEGIPKHFPERGAVSAAPPPPPGAFQMRRRVAWDEIDQMQHVNNAVYLDYATECGMQVIAAHHWPVTRMLADGFGILLRRNQIQYLQPALLDDELEICTWVSNLRFSKATRHYKISRVSDHEIVAWIHALGVWVDLKSGRPIRIPTEMINDFAPNIVA